MPDRKAPTFEEIVAEFSGSLTAYLRRMIGNSADADDLLQETLMRIAAGLPQFEQRSSPKTWVYRIATNVAIDNLRKNKNVVLTEFDEEIKVEEVAHDKGEDRLVLDEMNQCIRDVIERLPPEYRAVAVLYNLQGKSIAETAEICGITVSSAKVRIHRAKGRLKEALDRQCDLYKSPEGTLRCDRKNPTGQN